MQYQQAAAVRTCIRRPDWSCCNRNTVRRPVQVNKRGVGGTGYCRTASFTGAAHRERPPCMCRIEILGRCNATISHSKIRPSREGEKLQRLKSVPHRTCRASEPPHHILGARLHRPLLARLTGDPDTMAPFPFFSFCNYYSSFAEKLSTTDSGKETEKGVK